MTYVTITPTDNGPYLVTGGATLVDAEGNEYEARDPIALCRCGRSSTKPFCDGAHEQAASPRLERTGQLRRSAPS